MNPIDYSQLPLRDIHMPAPVAWWPPAIGWWLVLGIVVVAAAVAWFRYRSRFRERAALRGLKAVATALANGSAPAICLQQISMILRRFAMSIDAPVPVAGLTGDEWLRFLDSRWQRNDFAEGDGRLLIYGPYAPEGRVGPDDVESLARLGIEWVRAQRPAEK
ncbi:MAG: DUF4381 domain-containing protein [Gammaproteobacteria bacterium]|nr:DUF4381 domain-containing protein [Gammaproteobacteria bacterium]